MSEYAICSDNYIFVHVEEDFLSLAGNERIFNTKTLKSSYKSHVAHCS